MTTSLKDVTTAQITSKLADMDCFAREYVVWGFGWLEDGRLQWCAGEDARLLRRSYEARLLAGAAVTPFDSSITRTVLSEENLSDGLLLLRLRLLKQLRNTYGHVYFEALQALRVCSADDQAYPLLRDWQDEIDGYFEGDDLALFEGAVREAVLRGHLYDSHAQQLLSWSRQARTQNEKGNASSDQYVRTFCGCALTVDGQHWQWLGNANEEVFWNQLDERLTNGAWHTPVWRKTLWFHRMDELPDVRKRFMDNFKQVADSRYLERMSSLEALPSHVPEPLWQTWLETVQKSCSSTAQQGFLRISRQIQLGEQGR